MGSVTLRVPQERAPFPTCWWPVQSSPCFPSRTSSLLPPPSIARETAIEVSALHSGWCGLQTKMNYSQCAVKSQVRGTSGDSHLAGGCLPGTHSTLVKTRTQGLGCFICLFHSLIDWMRFSQLDGHQARPGLLPGFGSKDKVFKICAPPLPPFLIQETDLCGSLPASALLHESGQHSFKSGLACGMPTETEVLHGKGQSGDRWGWEKCCGLRGDLLADFRALFSACWQHASTEGAVDSLMLGSWLDFRA